MRNFYIVLNLCLGSLTFATAGTLPQNLGSYWTAVPSTCGWEEGAEKIIDTGKADVGFASGQMSSFNAAKNTYKALTVRCNVLNTGGSIKNPGWNNLSVGYSDPDAAGDKWNVNVKVYQIDPTTGLTPTYPITKSAIPVVEFDSSKSNLIETEDTLGMKSFAYSFDFSKFNYVAIAALTSKQAYSDANATASTPNASPVSPSIFSIRLDRIKPAKN